MVYRVVQDGEKVILPGRHLRLACCDCGLIHDIRFAVYRGKISYRAWRNGRATGGKRKAKGVKVVKTRG